ncbi:MAG: guanylate kinase [Verrucomicrobia bacterium]|nr:guanylate kinase [Verrucomicrobiota bacterium]
MNPKNRFEPLVLIVSAPSGAGKSTLVDRLLESDPKLRRVVTCTTRAPRADETEGDAYHFLDRADFDARIERGDFVEWNEIYGQRYGTSKEVFERDLEAARRNGEDLVLVIDVDGKDNFIARYGKAVTIFILPPSVIELHNRIAERGTENAETAARRLARADTELARAARYDYRVTNDSIERALEELRRLVAAERGRRSAAPDIDNSATD